MSEVKPRAVARLAVGEAERQRDRAVDRASKLASLVDEYKRNLRDRNEQVRELSKQIGARNGEIAQQRKTIAGLQAHADKQIARAEDAEALQQQTQQELSTLTQRVADALGIKVRK